MRRRLPRSVSHTGNKSCGRTAFRWHPCDLRTAQA